MDITSHEPQISLCILLRRRALTGLFQSTGLVSYSAVSKLPPILTVISYQGRGHRWRPDVRQGARAPSFREISTRRRTYRFLPFIAWPDCADKGPAAGTIAPQLSEEE